VHRKIRHTAIGAIAAVVTAATTPATKADFDVIRQNYTATNRDCGDTVGLGGSAFFTLTVGAAAGYSPKCVLFVLNEDTDRGKTIAISGYPPFILWPGQAVTVLNQNNVWQFTPQGQRWKLTDNTTFYVDQVSGNDSDDGLAPEPSRFSCRMQPGPTLAGSRQRGLEVGSWSSMVAAARSLARAATTLSTLLPMVGRWRAV
jgi:hypothetical protein